MTNKLTCNIINKTLTENKAFKKLKSSSIENDLIEFGICVKTALLKPRT